MSPSRREVIPYSPELECGDYGSIYVELERALVDNERMLYGADKTSDVYSG